MPTYLYQCQQCGEFEQQQAISEPPLDRCPRCGGAVHRLIAGGTNFIVKGRGAAARHCERTTPCCGRETRCDRPPCGK
ncbi:MAG: zinc ribbon domain-containing protein [Deltaproteobacteria bacterium]|nr:zinc ribbon domain-containing protein [Deltaproteobacteria bacterium]